MQKANKIIMVVAGLLLVFAAALKFQEMVGTCVPSWDIKTQVAITAAQQAGEQIPVWKAHVLGFWESYEFNLIQIPLEFALGVWMLSGLFRKAAWLVGTLAYFFFIFVTLTKWLTGAASCGCFGQIHVEPWKTLFFVDIPFFLLLALFRPKDTKLLPPPWPNLAWLLVIFVPTIGLMVTAPAAMVAFRKDCIKVGNPSDATAALKLEVYKLKKDVSQKQQEIDDLKKAIVELKQAPRTTDKKAFIGVLEVIATERPNFYEIHIGDKQTLYLNAENLEKIYLSVRDMGSQEFSITQDGRVEMKWTEPQLPETTNVTPPVTDANETVPAAAQWDWLQYVAEDDVRQQISKGLTVVLMYHHDCEVCAEKVPAYSKYYSEMLEQGNSELKIAFLAIPPYGETGPVPEDTACILGKLTDEKAWMIMSPYVVALLDGQKVKEWPQGTAPEPENLVSEILGE